MQHLIVSLMIYNDKSYHKSVFLSGLMYIDVTCLLKELFHLEITCLLRVLLGQMWPKRPRTSS